MSPHTPSHRWSFASSAACALTLITLTGCATDCNFLSAHKSASCNAGQTTALIVSAPVLLPYAAIKNTQENHAAAQSESALRTSVISGDLVASEQCVYTCPGAYRKLKEDRWRIHQLAATRVTQAYADEPELTARQQANLFAAHKVLADTLGANDPQARVLHLQATVRIGQSQDMWNYVRKDSKEGNDLPVNSGHFSSAANDVVIDLLLLQHATRARASTVAEASAETEASSETEMSCDFSSFGNLVSLSGALKERSLCELATDQWKRRRDTASKNE